MLALRKIRQQVLVPIHRLGRNADRLAMGDYAGRTGELRGFEELTALGRTMDTMAQAIEDDIGQRREVQQELEVAGLGGGIVEIGEGEFRMRDSLHLRPRVTVRGQGAKTVLRKAPGVMSALALDGDYGEEQVKCPGNRFGQNGGARIEYETVAWFQKPERKRGE